MTSNEIYEKTNGGLDIIMRVLDCASTTKNFSYRSDDRHPSARVYPPNGNRNYYIVKDFGGEGETWFSPIDVFMHAKGLVQADYHLALQMIAEEFGLTEGLDRNVNRPRIETRSAREGEHDGDHPFLLKTSISESEARIWGDVVKPEHLEELGWSAVESISSVKGNKVTTTFSTASYPIFIQSNCYTDEHRQRQTFYKVYQPLNYDKQFRFYSIGQKPRNYIFGMDALTDRYERNDRNPLDAAAIVSGGSDAANCLAMGLQPVWLNSETADFLPSDMQKLRKMAKTIYAIFDCDATGVARATRLALQYIDIKVVWLSAKKLGNLHDNRGNRLKDLKDFIKLYPAKERFQQLLSQAMSAKFWSEVKGKYSSSLTQLCYFLRLNGYMVYRDSVTHAPQLVHICKRVVEKVQRLDIMSFLKDWMMEKGLSVGIIDKVMMSKGVTTPSVLDANMEQAMLDFSTATPYSQWFYCMNCCVEVTKDSIRQHSYEDLADSGRYVWKDRIIPHNYVPHDPMFSIKRNDDGTYAIDILSTDSEVFCFLINASRNHWRKEMEYRFATKEERDEYARTHHFCINGEGLSEEEIGEQMQSLVNKIFDIGYHLHQYKTMSRAWGTFCYDWKISENDECDGRTGKSLYGKILKAYIPTVTIEAKNRNVTDIRFLYAQVTEATDLLIIDECHKALDFTQFFARITDDFQIEKKGQDPQTIQFANSPKLLIATNFINKNNDASTIGRELPVVFSDYYHQKAHNNDYLENRSVADDFGHNLIDDQYRGWEADIAFLTQCEQFYLSAIQTNEKILPPLTNIHKRQQKARAGSTFSEWADDYYQPDGGHLDRKERRDDVYASYKNYAGEKHIKETRLFISSLKEYCQSADHIAIYNPKDITGQARDGERWRISESAQRIPYIYVRSKAEAEKPKDELPF